jgi:tight adherence protein B
VRRLAAAAALAAALAVTALQSAEAGGGFAIHRVDVTGYPTVTLVVAGAGKRLPPLYENGARVASRDAQNLGANKAIVLAVDRSKSMTGAPLTRAAAAAASFVHRKPQSDLVSIVSFGSTALTQASLSQSTIDADTALRTLTPDRAEGTALWDAVVVSASKLSEQTYPGRVLILLTDGRNVRSLATFDDAVRAARRAGIVVYAIGLGHAYTPRLERLASLTGGKFYASSSPAALASIYHRIGGELDRTWRVSYTTGARPGDKLSLAVGSPHGAGTSAVVPGRPAGSGRTVLPRLLLDGYRGLLLVLVPVGLVFFLAVKQARGLPRSARIRKLVRTHSDPQRATPSRQRGVRATLAAVLASLDRPLRRVGHWKRLERTVETAGVPVSAATLLAGGLALALLLSIVAAIAGASGLLILLLFVVGAVTPVFAVRWLAARRIRAFEQQLPDVLTTIAGSLKVGHGLKAALQTVAQEGSPPVSVELQRVLAEDRLGRPLEDALVSMCERLASDDLLYVATAVDVHAQVGGSVAGVFQTVAETVRQRQQHRRRVRALSSMGRATAKVLAVMPLAFVAIISLVNPGYIGPFIHSQAGHALIAYSIVSIGVGFLILNRLVNVEE